MSQRLTNSIDKYLNSLARVNDILGGYNNTKAIYLDITHRWREKKYYFISIAFTDPIFPQVARHITKNTLQEHNRKNIAATPEGFIFSFRQSDSTMVKIEGESIYVFVSKEENVNNSGISRVDRVFNPGSGMSPSYLEFKCTSKEQFSIVDKWLEEIRLDYYTKDTRPRIYIASAWDDWSEYGRIPPRPLDSIILKAGQKERIIDDLSLFMESEKDYHSAGIPYHRGYMLYGPPGTGKTSFLLAMAMHFNKNICFMPSSSLKTEKGINELFTYVPKDSILVIEDVDTSFAVQSREVNDATENERTSLSAMLNTMDGITTPNGLILFMTTNDIEVIDDAILRPGRIDLKEKIGYMDKDQLERLISRFLGREFTLDMPSNVIEDMLLAPAEISELFKSCLRSREDIIPKVHELIGSRFVKEVV